MHRHRWTRIGLAAFALVMLPLAASSQGWDDERSRGRSAPQVPKLYDPDSEFAVGKSDMLFDFTLEPTVVRGDLELERVNFVLDWNYFLTDHVAPGFEVFAEKIADNNVQGGMLFTTRVYGQLDHSRLLPYGAVGLGFRAVELGGADEAFFALKMGGGVDYLLTPNVALGTEFTYTLLAGDFTQHELSIFPISFTLYFGGGIEPLDGLFD